MGRIKIGRDYYIDESIVNPFMREWLANRGYSTKYRTKTPVKSHIRKNGRRLTRVRKHLRHIVKKVKKPKRIVRRTIRYEPRKLTIIEINNLKNIPKREFDIENDVIDTVALIDSSLTYNENKHIIESYLKQMGLKQRNDEGKPIEAEVDSYVDNLVYKVSSGQNGETAEELKKLAKKGMISD